MPSNTFHTCRLCGHSDLGLFKYSVRSYAHPTCGLKKWGADFFLKLPRHELGQFPALVAHAYGLLPTLEKMACEPGGIQ
jgi:hypothetical protein